MVSNMIRRCYPGGASKAFNVTYDDGVTQDVHFVELLDRYGLKGTFNLNAQLMEDGFEWVHECGMTIKRLSPEEALQTYGDHEIASHTLTHPYMRGKTGEELLWEMGEDKRRLEMLFGREVAGFAVPFHYYSQQIAAMAQKCGFSYGRC
ncbi:MAG: polysaccharide deacetylase family protein, partial [Oscillospiraceae bacterium]|nr:polysaccharide deacetylase family protein [Oscillospiraceae bacterium]